jgi:hypothetical protein
MNGSVILTIALALVGLATVAVIISKSANTTGVIQAGSSGFAQLLGASLSPVTGVGSGGLLSNSSGIWT